MLHQPQRGYGIACLTGLAHLRDREAGPPEVVVIVDADYSDHPEQLPRLAAPVLDGRYDMVLGSRILGNAEPGSITLVQGFGNWLTTRLIGLRFGFRFTDMGPFRAVRFDRLMALGMTDETWGWNVEMQCKALHAGWAIHELPVDYRNRIGTSKISGSLRGASRAGVRIIWAMGKYGR